ncbi:MAG: hypothetical protein JW956_12615 [Calditrichaceae bacterium]|nr:hypothetical protein [Calditrichaceae bacterium]
MDQAWFEMNVFKRKKYQNDVWIPLRCIEKKRNGKYGYNGFQEEFVGVGSCAFDFSLKEEVEKLGWMDIGIGHNHSAWCDEEKYYPSDVFEQGNLLGIPLVLEQFINSNEQKIWHIHQDLVLALNLLREDDKWLAADEGYIEVVHLKRDENLKPVLMEIRAEFLRDYLCARNMGLYITSYKSRQEIVEDSKHIKWEDGYKEEKTELDRWEGRVFDIHEGGMPYGESAYIMHASRTDVDSDDDVPVMEGIPTDENVKSDSWTKKYSGRKLHTIWGEFWRKEWIEPGEASPRIKRDKIDIDIKFIIDSSGKRERSSILEKSSRWLWFKPEVMMALAHRRGGGLRWYTRDTGSVWCSPDHGVHFGVNTIGLINVYAKDVALLPEWEQRIWAGFNISPEGKVSKELLASQVNATPADTKSPEAHLPKAISLLNSILKDKVGIPLFREHQNLEEIIKYTHRFRSIDQSGFLSLAKDLARLTADSIDISPFKIYVTPPKKETWGSLKYLEKTLATKIDPDLARNIMSPFFGIYELRHADAHLPSSELEDALNLVQVNKDDPYVLQGFQLIHTCVRHLYKIADVLNIM